MGRPRTPRATGRAVDADRVFAHGRKDRLTEYDLGRFPGDSLFDRLARVVCRAGCLPRKELYEPRSAAWTTGAGRH